ncbi:tautomerase family protein [Pedobacter paludis]|uniref:4-oxalocrotonate tautomerase n=1 Tax=Pedobacter paludis TaxID=2203212 RepID=A0A317ETL0_9SPHI|nr:tautomerase family protein [Pedobacter paludis]PWS29762.1 4-oxalocrotonate tautomerase [Pedobacter paludis]
MPHIHVKIVGKTDEEKRNLSEAITEAVKVSVGADEANITISVEDVEKADWVEKVNKPDIIGHWDQLYKKPGYDHLK